MVNLLKQQQSDLEISVVRIQLEAGAYSPRLVFPKWSLWLDQEKPLDLGGGIFIQQSDRKCYLYRENATIEVFVNRHPLITKHLLKDGDFIHGKNFAAIFEADPVADFEEMLRVNDEILDTTITVTKRLAEHVVIDERGISLDAGQNFAGWNTIGAIYFVADPQTNEWAIRIGSVLGGEAKTIPTSKAIRALVETEINTLFNWINLATPVYNSYNIFASMNLNPDAYEILIYDKIYGPFLERKRLLPAPPSVLFQLANRRETLLSLLILIFFYFFGSCVFWGMFCMIPDIYPLELLLIIFLIVVAIGYKPLLDRIQHLFQLSKYEVLPE